METRVFGNKDDKQFWIDKPIQKGHPDFNENKNKYHIPMKPLGKFIIIVLDMIIVAIINGFAFAILWIWFIVPVFQVQPLRLVEAIGILLLIRFTISKRTKEPETSEFWEVFKEDMIFIVFRASFVIFSGWIVTLFL